MSERYEEWLESAQTVTRSRKDRLLAVYREQRDRIEGCENALRWIAEHCQEAIDADEDALLQWQAALAFTVACANTTVGGVPAAAPEPGFCYTHDRRRPCEFCSGPLAFPDACPACGSTDRAHRVLHPGEVGNVEPCDDAWHSVPAAAPPDLPEHLPTQLWLSERDGVSRIGRGPVVDERAREMGYREFVADVSNWRPVVPAAAPPTIVRNYGPGNPEWEADPLGGGLSREAAAAAPEIAGVEPSALGGGRSAGNARSTLRRDQARPRTTTTSADSNLGSAPACPACGSTDRAVRNEVGLIYESGIPVGGHPCSDPWHSVPAAAPEPKYEYRVVCPDGEACSMHVDFPAHGLAENDDVHCLHDEPGLHGVERREVGAWHSVEEGKRVSARCPTCKSTNPEVPGWDHAEDGICMDGFHRG